MHSLAETADKRFLTFAPGFWPNVAPELWNDWKWQLKNRVTNLQQLEEKIALSPEERAGVILSGNKLALAITPHFFNLIDPEDPHCPIRRQVIPRVEEADRSPLEMADPCGEDSHMPVPGLVLSILHTQPRRQRGRRTRTAYQFRGSLPVSGNSHRSSGCFAFWRRRPASF
jgi:lysine 2,3-aminomutase